MACLCMAVRLAVNAADSSPAYSFLNVPMSTRIYGLGGVNISLVDDDIASVDQNPALLGPEMSGQIAIGYMRYVDESNFAGLRFAHSAGAHGAWSAAVQYFGYGAMQQTDEMGNVTGDFSPKDALFMGAYSHDIADGLRGGICIKAAYSAIADYSALAIAADLGVNYYDAGRDLSLSATVANLGGQLKRFDQAYDRLPIDVRLGWSQVFGSFPVRFSATAWNLTRWKNRANPMRHIVLAADLVCSKNWYLGLGYNHDVRASMRSHSRGFMSGLSVCAGIGVSGFGVGLAFARPANGANTFMLNLSCSLSEII